MHKIASELVKIAKELVSADMFSTAKRLFDNVTPEQLSEIKKIARKNRGKVEVKSQGFGKIGVRVTFKDDFPETFATRDAEKFDADVKHLNLEKFQGISF